METFRFAIFRATGDSGLSLGSNSATKFLLSDFFPHYRFDHSWPGNKGVTYTFDHKYEIHQSRRIYGAAGTWA